jgi:DNA-binding response OmpR family regulator
MVPGNQNGFADVPRFGELSGNGDIQVVLSANNSIDMKIEGVASGADVYIAKPFDTNYLKIIVERLIVSRVELKEYYNYYQPCILLKTTG